MAPRITSVIVLLVGWVASPIALAQSLFEDNPTTRPSQTPADLPPIQRPPAQQPTQRPPTQQPSQPRTPDRPIPTRPPQGGPPTALSPSSTANAWNFKYATVTAADPRPAPPGTELIPGLCREEWAQDAGAPAMTMRSFAVGATTRHLAYGQPGQSVVIRWTGWLNVASDCVMPMWAFGGQRLRMMLNQQPLFDVTPDADLSEFRKDIVLKAGVHEVLLEATGRESAVFGQVYVCSDSRWVPLSTADLWCRPVTVDAVAPVVSPNQKVEGLRLETYLGDSFDRIESSEQHSYRSLVSVMQIPESQPTWGKSIKARGFLSVTEAGRYVIRLAGKADLDVEVGGKKLALLDVPDASKRQGGSLPAEQPWRAGVVEVGPGDHPLVVSASRLIPTRRHARLDISIVKENAEEDRAKLMFPTVAPITLRYLTGADAVGAAKIEIPQLSSSSGYRPTRSKQPGIQFGLIGEMFSATDPSKRIVAWPSTTPLSDIDDKRNRCGIKSNQNVVVRYRGWLQPPVAGDYNLSIGTFRYATMTIRVGETEVYRSDGKTVTEARMGLSAGPYPLEIECHGSSFFPSFGSVQHSGSQSLQLWTGVVFHGVPPGPKIEVLPPVINRPPAVASRPPAPAAQSPAPGSVASRTPGVGQLNSGQSGSGPGTPAKATSGQGVSSQGASSANKSTTGTAGATVLWTLPPPRPAVVGPTEGLALPGGSAIGLARTELRRQYADYYADRRPVIRQSLMARLNAESRQPQPPEKLIAMLCELADVAGSIGEGAMVRTALERSVASFGGDPGGAVATVAEVVVPHADRVTATATELRALVERHLASADQSGRFDVCMSLSGSMQALSGKDLALAAAWRTRREHYRQLTAETQRIALVTDALKANPADNDAAVQLGKFECLVRGRWDVGLPFLARAADADLKQIAALELQPQCTADDLLRLGLAWMGRALLEREPYMSRCRMRGVEILRLVLEKGPNEALADQAFDAIIAAAPAESMLERLDLRALVGQAFWRGRDVVLKSVAVEIPLRSADTYELTLEFTPLKDATLQFMSPCGGGHVGALVTPKSWSYMRESGREKLGEWIAPTPGKRQSVTFQIRPGQCSVKVNGVHANKITGISAASVSSRVPAVIRIHAQGEVICHGLRLKAMP